MDQQTADHMIRDRIGRMETDAVERCGVPRDIATRAARATARVLQGEIDEVRLERRAKAYFWTVVRRSLIRGRSAPDVTARFMLSTVAADLRAAGRSPAAVWEELVRGWSDKVPVHVLEEYRERLCA